MQLGANEDDALTVTGDDRPLFFRLKGRALTILSIFWENFEQRKEVRNGNDRRNRGAVRDCQRTATSAGSEGVAPESTDEYVPHVEPVTVLE